MYNKKITSITINFGRFGKQEIQFIKEKDPDLTDIEIKFGEGNLCISGDNKHDFLKDFKKLIERYYI